MHSRRCLSQLMVSGAALLIAVALRPEFPEQPLPVSSTVTIVNYHVRGASERAIRHSLRSRGPRDRSQLPRDAYCSWTIRWRWNEALDGMVDPETARVLLEAKIVAPQISKLIAGRNPRWKEYRAALIRHELHHARSALRESEILSAKFRQLAGRNQYVPVEELHQLGRHAVTLAREYDRLYDRDTRHGKTEGVSW